MSMVCCRSHCPQQSWHISWTIRAPKGPGNGALVKPGASLPQREHVIDSKDSAFAPADCPAGRGRGTDSRPPRLVYALAYLTCASLTHDSSLMYTQPMSNSYQRAANLAEWGSAWWLLC